jgi:uncharacterized membrane protein YdjX (TVP38/TMEM64 family)
MDGFVHHNVGRRAAILFVACIALAALASAHELHTALLGLLHAAEAVIERHPTAGILLFVAVTALSAMLAFVSVAVVVPAAVLAWDEPMTLMLLWLGWILGGICSYAIGRFLGRPAVRWLTTKRTLSSFEHRVHANAPFWLVLLLQLALPSEVLGYMMGIARYSFARYLLALALAELPYSFATVLLGTGFLEHRGSLILAMGISIAMLSIGALYALRRVPNSGSRTRQA